MTGVMHDPGTSANFRYTTSTDMTVLAVGRCHSCNSAFCATHQGRTNSGNTKYTDLCNSCRAAGEALKRARAGVAQSANEPSLLATIAQAMHERNVGGLEQRHFQWETTALGQDHGWGKPRVHHIAHEFAGVPAWRVGLLPVTERLSYGFGTPERPCGVTAIGAIVLMADSIPACELFRSVEYGESPAKRLDADLLSLRKDADLVELGQEAVSIAARRLNAIAQRHGLNLARTLDWPDELASSLDGSTDTFEDPNPAAARGMATHQTAELALTKRQRRRKADIDAKRHRLHGKIQKINARFGSLPHVPGTPKSRERLALEQEQARLRRDHDELGREYADLTGREPPP